MPIIENLWAAIALIAPRITLDRSAIIIAGKPPFALACGSGGFTYSPKPETIHAYMEGMIFLDVVRVAGLPRELQISSFLEELVHVFMRVHDETLVSHIVGLMGPGVSLVPVAYVAQGIAL